MRGESSANNSSSFTPSANCCNDSFRVCSSATHREPCRRLTVGPGRANPQKIERQKLDFRAVAALFAPVLAYAIDVSAGSDDIRLSRVSVSSDPVRQHICPDAVSGHLGAVNGGVGGKTRSMDSPRSNFDISGSSTPQGTDNWLFCVDAGRETRALKVEVRRMVC